jgi:hypothetical protein
MKLTAFFLLISLLTLSLQADPPKESDYYTITPIPAPAGEVIEGGGIELLPDGRVAVCTRRGAWGGKGARKVSGIAAICVWQNNRRHFARARFRKKLHLPNPKLRPSPQKLRICALDAQPHNWIQLDEGFVTVCVCRVSLDQ